MPGLFQGGTPLEHWSSDETGFTHDEADPIEGHFDAVVSLFAWSRPCDWGVEELRYRFPDAHPQHADMSRWCGPRARRTTVDRSRPGADPLPGRIQPVRAGDPAMVPIFDGWSAEDAIRQIRRHAPRWPWSTTTSWTRWSTTPAAALAETARSAA